MIRKLVFSTVFSVLLAVAQFSYAGSTDKVVVPLNRAEIITLPRAASEVVIANEKVATVVKHSGRKWSIVGNRFGHTYVQFLNGKRQVIHQTNVRVTHDIPAIRKSLKDFFPYENVAVEMVNDSIALTGRVTDAEIAARIVQIAEEYIDNQEEIDGGKLINLMEIRTGQQVMLRVRVGEIQRTALKKLGVSVSGLHTNSDFSLPFATGGGVGNALGTIAPANDAFGTLGVIYNDSSINLSASLDMLEQDGLFKVLAEPNLVAISGESAEFLAGGEFPIPVIQGTSALSIDYKPFGVSVGFTPNVLSQNRIRLAVEPEVSEISNTGNIQFGNFSVPSITSRRARTTVELAPGESFMIAGLIKDELISSIKEIPGLSSLPVLSALVRSSAFQRNETELVIAVTPYIVDPVASADLRLPTDDFRPASMMETVFFGALGSMAGKKEVVSQLPGLEGSVGYIVD